MFSVEQVKWLKVVAMSSDAEIVSERLLNATPEQVFDAYRDPRRFARWWGPNGFTSDFVEFDFRPGGNWRFTFRGPDGTEYYNESTFTEIESPSRIVLEHLRPMHRFDLTMTLMPEGSRTRLKWVMRFDTPEEAEKVRNLCTDANQQNFDRLERELGLRS